MKFHENISNNFYDMARTHVYGGNGHFQYSKGNNSKSRKTRVTVHVFCMSPLGVNICVKFHENMSSGFKVMERTRKLLTHKGQYLQKYENQSYGSCVLHFLLWC